METQIELSVSFGRMACLAALELERIAMEGDGSLHYVEQFIATLSSEIAAEECHGSESLQQHGFYAFNPSTAYAVNSGLMSTHNLPASMSSVNDFIGCVRNILTHPLQELVDQHRDKEQIQKNKAQTLSDLCLHIAESYSSLELREDDADLHPFR